MTATLKILLVMCISFLFMSCGKRGDLLPPPGYEAPSENN